MRGAAVTGPTVAGRTGAAIAAIAASLNPSRSQAARNSTTPCADVKATASTSAAATIPTARLTASGSGEGPHRYTTRDVTRAPNSTRSSSMPSLPAP